LVKKKEEREFNVFDHELVPKHILLSKEEADKVLSTYKIKPYQLPRIKVSDPAVETLGGKPGDIVKIIRKSPTAGEVIYYRYVVEE
jgi:DNA-directed RNA polymerase subunit H